MTPAEMREVLLDEARWWANQPAHSGTAQRWVTFFEQLPDDNRMLVTLSGMYQDANAYRNRPRDLRVDQFIVEHDLPDHREGQRVASLAGRVFRHSRKLNPKRQAAWHLANPPTVRDGVGACRGKLPRTRDYPASRTRMVGSVRRVMGARAACNKNNKARRAMSKASSLSAHTPNFGMHPANCRKGSLGSSA